MCTAETTSLARNARDSTYAAVALSTENEGISAASRAGIARCLCDAYYVQPSFVDVGEVLARRDARGLGARETATEADEHRDRGLFAPNRHRTLHCGS